MSDKQVSAAVLILDPVTNSILCSHATGAPFESEEGIARGCWGLLKGLIDKGESAEEAAVREVYEESGIKINKKDLIHLGYQEYTVYKDLELFLYIDNEHIDHTQLKCDSYFENDDGEILPEVNAYAWFNYPDEKKYLYKSQQVVIDRVWDKVQDIINESNVKIIESLTRRLNEDIVDEDDEDYFTDDFRPAKNKVLAKCARKISFDQEVEFPGEDPPTKYTKSEYNPVLKKIDINQLSTIQLDYDDKFQRLPKVKFDRIADFSDVPIFVVGNDYFKEYVIIDGNNRAAYNKQNGNKTINAWVSDPFYWYMDKPKN